MTYKTYKTYDLRVLLLKCIPHYRNLYFAAQDRISLIVSAKANMASRLSLHSLSLQTELESTT